MAWWRWGRGRAYGHADGVTQGEADRSGFAAFDPAGGGLVATAGVGVRQRLTERWSVSVSGRVGQILRQAADSPIVADAGSDDFATTQIGLTFKIW